MRGTTHFPATSGFKICTFWPLIEQWWEGKKGSYSLIPFFPHFLKWNYHCFKLKTVEPVLAVNLDFRHFQYYLILIALRLHFSVAGVKDRQAPDLGQPFGKAVRVARCTI